MHKVLFLLNCEMLLSTITRLGFAVLIAAWMSLRGLKKRSLSPSGAVAAFIVGLASFGVSIIYGATLIAFYLTGSRATRVKQELKKKWDVDVTEGEGNRGAIQVFCTAGVPTILAIVNVLLTGIDDASPRLDVCRGSAGALSTLLVGVVASYATACGDTLASELGILSQGPPFLVLGCRRVPRGTNGGVSAWGLLMSLAGGALIGAVAYAVIVAEDAAAVLLGTGPVPPYCTLQALLVPLGAAAGLGGSVLDSLLGATLQQSYVEVATGRATCHPPEGASIVRDADLVRAAIATQSAATQGSSASAGKPLTHTRQKHDYTKSTAPGTRVGAPAPAASPRVFVVVSGWPILSNEAVNFLSGLLTAAAVMAVLHNPALSGPGPAQ